MENFSNKPVRIKDIAIAAGVSVGTVDRVIHNRGRVSQEKKNMVLKAMERLNYKPNLTARSLALSKQFRLACFIPKIGVDAFWTDIRNGILSGFDYIRNFGFGLELYFFDEEIDGDLYKFRDRLDLKNYDAILLAPTIRNESHDFLELLEQYEIPYLLINTDLERSHEFSLGYVGQDSFQSGYLAAKLLSQNCATVDPTFLVLHMEKRVGLGEHLNQKESGFQSYFKDKKPTNNIQVIDVPEFANKKALQKRVENLIAKFPKIEGIFVTTSRLHFIVDVLLAMGQDHIRLVGFDLIKDNIEALAKYENIFLINQNPYQQGYYGVLNFFKYLLQKKQIQKKFYLPLDIITFENYRYYENLNEFRLGQG